ncbi:hypothetical protein CSPX01_06729, partial [Colletotrichum filicis]
FISSHLALLSRTYLPEGETSTSESNAAFVVVFVKGTAYSRLLLAIADTASQAANTSCAAIHRISDCPPALNTECSRSKQTAASEQHRFQKNEREKKRGILAHLSIHSPPSPSPSLLQHSLFGPSTTARVSKPPFPLEHASDLQEGFRSCTHPRPRVSVRHLQPAAYSPLAVLAVYPLVPGQISAICQGATQRQARQAPAVFAFWRPFCRQTQFRADSSRVPFFCVAGTTSVPSPQLFPQPFLRTFLDRQHSSLPPVSRRRTAGCSRLVHSRTSLTLWSVCLGDLETLPSHVDCDIRRLTRSAVHRVHVQPTASLATIPKTSAPTTTHSANTTSPLSRRQIFEKLLFKGMPTT